jgi:hypothetical protein
MAMDRCGLSVLHPSPVAYFAAGKGRSGSRYNEPSFLPSALLCAITWPPRSVLTSSLSACSPGIFLSSARFIQGIATAARHTRQARYFGLLSRSVMAWSFQSIGYCPSARNPSRGICMSSSLAKLSTVHEYGVSSILLEPWR